MSLIPEEIVAEYVARGWWGNETLSERVRANRARLPEGDAFVTDAERMTWRGYDETADAIAHQLLGSDLRPGDRVGVLLDDGPLVHAAFLGCERAGVVAVGLGARAGDRELRHLLAQTGARALVSQAVHRDVPIDERVRGIGIADLAALVVPEAAPGPTVADRRELAERRIGPNDLFLLNSTSGTTGLPKCVTQFQNRWFFFHQLAVRTGRLTEDDVFLSAIPTPFGFGLWTAHFTPTLLAAPTVLMPRFDAEQMLRLIERERVTIIAAVSTQFMMMLNHPRMGDYDLSSMRAMYTGGEAVPYERALEFERRTGAMTLQFFGSNETGAFSGTSLDDPVERRLTTAGKVIPEMDVRLFDDDGADVTGSGGPAQPGGRGPATCAGYYDDDDANAELYTPGGHMLMGDYVEVDGDGYLSVVGRKSDFIIRGGKNISAPQVEAEIGTHPAVDLVAVVRVADAVFGERVCAVVTLRVGAQLTLDDLVAHLTSRSVSKELFPEQLVVIDDMPMASGGKIAKSELEQRVAAIVPTARASS